MTGTMLDVALEWAGMGRPVFPCGMDKKPLVGGGFKAATTDHAKIREWWNRWPHAMVGMPTGKVSGIVVVDLDIDPAKGLDGLKELASLGLKHDPTLTVMTPRGGRHLYFSAPEHEVRNSASQIGRGIDVRGDGGYVIAAGSTNGEGKTYRREGDFVTVPCPPWVGKTERPREEQNRQGRGEVGQPHRRARPGLSNRERAYATKALEEERRNVASAPDGQRNHALNASAFKLFQLVAGGLLSEREVMTAMEDAAQACELVKEDGWPSVRKTLASARDAGLAQPRGMPEGDYDSNTRFKPEDDAGPSDHDWDNLAEQVGEGDDPYAGVSMLPYICRAEADIPRRDWIVPSLLQRGQITAVYAAGGTGKSSFGLAVALHVAAGKSYGPFKVPRPLKVALLTLEEDAAEIDRRISALMRMFEITASDIEGRLCVVSLGKGGLLARANQKGTIQSTPKMGGLRRRIAEEKVDLVLIDPFVEVWDGDENANMAIKAVAGLIRDIARSEDTAIMLFHHVKKGTVTPGDPDAGRGGGALTNLARLAFTMTRMTRDEASMLGLPEGGHVGKVRLDLAKGNYAKQAERAYWFEFVTVTLDNGFNGEFADEVGVLKPWIPPGLFENTTHQQLNAILDAIKAGIPAKDDQPVAYYSAAAQSTDRYVGNLIDNMMGWDNKSKRGGRIARSWLKSGLLYEFNYKDARSHNAKGLKVDESKRPSAIADVFDTISDDE